MFDPITLGLIGSAIGGLTSKKPLKGALLGGAMGAGGGLLAGGMGGAGGAAGLLGNPMTAGAYGTGLGTQQTAMLAAQEAGMGAMPIAGSMFGNASSALKTAKPFMDAAGTGMQVAGAMTPPEQGAPPPPQLAPQMGAQTLETLAQRDPQAELMAEAEQRKKRRIGLLGAYA